MENNNSHLAVPLIVPEEVVSVSTLEQLIAEINSATVPKQINLTNDINLTGSRLVIPAGKEIMLKGNSGKKTINAQQLSGAVYMEPGSSLQ